MPTATTRARSLDSAEPLMSPAWSPDGQNLAYVSFEGKASAIYVQRLATGERRRVSARAGINGAPGVVAGRSHARADALARRQPRRLHARARDAGADAHHVRRRPSTPSRSGRADGQSLYFTSDRAGNAADLRVALDKARRRAERVTFTNGLQRTAAAVAGRQGTRRGHPRSRQLPRSRVVDLASRNLRVLTQWPPGRVAPASRRTGRLLIYATRDAGPRRARDASS